MERWDADDWSRLWWVRAELRFEANPRPQRAEALAARLADRVPQDRDRPFARVLALRVVGVIGWTATAD